MSILRGRPWPTVWELVPAAFVAVLAPVITAGIATSDGLPYDALGALLVVASGVALLAGRAWPTGTLIAVSTLVTVYLWRGYPYGPIWAAVIVALVGVALRLPLRRSVPVAAVAVLILSGHVLLRPDTPNGGLGPSGPAEHGGPSFEPWMQAAFGIGWAAMLFAVGVTIRTRRHARRQERTDQVRSLVDAERLRMSHDVHDGVGHGLAAINMQASLGLRSLRKNPDRAEEALLAIRDSSATALTELRAVLARMDAGDVAATRRPGQGLGDIPDLAGRLEQAGMAVRVDGQTALEVPAAVDLAAYRVVQESLTNALRHGTGEAAHVTVRRTTEGLTVSVRNPVAEDGTPSESGGGRGIPGMRARVEAVGGTLSAERGRNEFEVRAVLPLTEEAP